MSKPMQPKLIEQVSKIAAETAVNAVMEYLEQEKQKQENVKRDRRLRNTKMLLRNYRSLKSHCADIVLEIDEMNELLDLDDLDTDVFAIESIRKSKERTLAMVKFIDQMMKVYEFICEEAGRDDDLRRYQVIHHLYIASERKTVDELSECHNVVTRTIHRDVNVAVKTLSSLIFGVDGIRFTG